MRLRVSTAMALVLSMGTLAACGEEEAEVEVEESAVEVPAEEVIVEEEAAEADVEAVVVEEEPAEDVEVIAEAGDEAEPIELETDVESDGEPIVASTETDPAADDAAIEEVETDAAEVETETAEPLVTEGDVEAAEAEAATEETLGEVATDDEELATAGTASSPEGEDDLITLDTNVTVVDDADAEAEGETAEVAGAESALGEGTDAEATVDPAAPAEAQVEETNDVATDGVDSASEANMLDLDNLVLDDAGVQQLTEYVEASDQIDETQKVTLVAGIDAARDNPERLEELLDQIRELTAQ